MTIIGVDESGTIGFRVYLDHGADPAALAHDRGFAVVRPLDAVRDQGGDLVLTMLVRPLGEEPRPPARGLRRDRGLVITDDRAPLVRTASRGIRRRALDAGPAGHSVLGPDGGPGRWGMPGGGLDDHEDPAQRCSARWSRRPPRRLFWATWPGAHLALDRPQPARDDRGLPCRPAGLRGHCPEPTDPVVLDADGTTRSARWVALDDWRKVRWTANWRDVLRAAHPGSPAMMTSQRLWLG